MSDAAKNRARLEAIERRLASVRDRLATAAAQVGPLFREVAEISDELASLLATTTPPAPPPPATLDSEMPEFATDA